MGKHIVKCRYCKESFDTFQENYVMPIDKWYYHTECYNKKLEEEGIITEKSREEKEDKLKKPKTDIKICFYCKQPLDILSEPWCKPTTTRYAHKKCYDEHRKDEEGISSDDIYYFMKNEAHVAVDYSIMERQRVNMMKKNGYTNRGILNALRYFYIVKKGDGQKAKGGIGIVPFVYDDAKHYYDNLERKQKEISKSLLKGLNNGEINIEIKIPEKDMKRKLIDLDMIGGEEELDR